MSVGEIKILGVNTRHYPTQWGTKGTDKECCHIDGWSEEPPAVRAVLVAGDIGDYACYVGIGEPEWIAMHGDKISFAEACCHFPMGLKKENYRA